MKRSLLSLLVSLFLPVGLFAADEAERETQSAAARAILDEWRKDHAEPAERFLHVVCWTPSDREFPADHRARLSRMLLHIRDFYAREMERNGFGRASIRLQIEDDGLVKMHEVRGNDPTGAYGLDSGSAIRRECLPHLREAGIDADRETIAIFCNLATWDEKERRFSHKSPYYAGGDYRSGTAWQLDSPELDTLHLDKQQPTIRDGQYGRISLGKHNSIFIGGMAHEFGHALGLPHARESGAERELGTALMGSGNRTYGDELRGEGKGSFLAFAHALRLASHPQFSGFVAKEPSRSRVELTDVDVRADEGAVVLSGRIEGSPPIYGVVAYFDPEGGGDYDAAVASAVPDADGRFELRTDDLAKGKPATLRLVPLHADGSVPRGDALARMRYPYRVADDGTPDLTTVRIRQALEPVVAALDRDDVAAARKLASEIDLPPAAAIASRLCHPPTPTQTPAEYDGDETSVDLTRFRPETAEVGWLRPTYDRVPEASLVLESGGEFFATGIYAHAPARHVYPLGGKWDRLSGRAGLAAGHGGSVEFRILVDGQERWKSPVMRGDRTVAFDVDLRRANAVELSTGTADDGAGADWALWLEPRLSRDSP